MSTQEISPSPDLTRLTLFGPAPVPEDDDSAAALFRKALDERDYPAIITALMNDVAPTVAFDLTTVLEAEEQDHRTQAAYCAKRAREARAGGMTQCADRMAILSRLHADWAAEAHEARDVAIRTHWQRPA
jgi:hypothetical protein